MTSTAGTSDPTTGENAESKPVELKLATIKKLFNSQTQMQIADLIDQTLTDYLASCLDGIRDIFHDFTWKFLEADALQKRRESSLEKFTEVDANQKESFMPKSFNYVPIRLHVVKELEK